MKKSPYVRCGFKAADDARLRVLKQAAKDGLPPPPNPMWGHTGRFGLSAATPKRRDRPRWSKVLKPAVK